MQEDPVRPETDIRPVLASGNRSRHVTKPRSPREQLDEVVRAVAENSSIASKRDIGLVSESLGASGWVQGPGDDGAAVDINGSIAIVCGEALWPPFVKADPRGAGIAAVLANVNDVAAMGGTPVGIVDTIVADHETARAALEGMRYAADLYRVPIVGGHLTISTSEPAISAFAIGHADALLSTTHVAVGQDLVVAVCIDGTMRPDFPFFASFDERGESLGDDVRLLPRIAEAGLARAAKDISMAGLVGSLAMLLEWGAFGASIDLDALPAPVGVPLAQWCNCFPCFGFLLCCDPSTTLDCIDVFVGAGICAAKVGVIDPTGIIELRAGGESRTAMDLNAVSVTGLVRGVSR